MSFASDKQTLEDLNIFGRPGTGSIFSIYNRTHTRGGAAILEQMFHEPLSRAASINERSGIIQYFAAMRIGFRFPSELFDTVEQWLDNIDERTKLPSEGFTFGRKLSHLIASDPQYKFVYQGVRAIQGIFHALRDFLGSVNTAPGDPYHAERMAISGLLANTEFSMLMGEGRKRKLSFTCLADLDVILRFRHRDSVKKLLRHIYYLDVYISVAAVATERKFAFPKALEKDRHGLRLEGVFHPFLAKPVPNTLDMTADSNLIFLTGANMAGKSTFMKTLGTALFLAHMGFPVAAEKMEFTVMDGMYTTINLSDNLGMGVSHFYAEVLRVKKVAKELGLGKDLFVIFDELFRGTNVKDAYEATIAVVSAFAGRRNSMFVISTHIMEAGEILKERHDNIAFRYMPTRMNGRSPVSTYRLEPGITNDRHGMIILNNEGILEILKRGKLVQHSTTTSIP